LGGRRTATLELMTLSLEMPPVSVVPYPFHTRHWKHLRSRVLSNLCVDACGLAGRRTFRGSG
jgi:hypothetical protein